MNHLNEDKLIQYAFDLAEPGDRENIQSHLDECGDCRDALEALKAKFAVMDTLAEEVPPSEELIQQTLAHSGQQPASPAGGEPLPGGRLQPLPSHRRFSGLRLPGHAAAHRSPAPA